MAERKTYRVGETVNVAEGTAVTRPDLTTRVIHGTRYVLDVAGEFRIGDRTVTVRVPRAASADGGD